MVNRIRQIGALGQAIWLDFISRELLRSGKLAELVDEGVRGVTSNPTIFQKSVAAGSDYDDQIAELARRDRSTYEIYEALAIQDIRQAADILRPVYNETHGRDGFVSIEVNPRLAFDTDGTIEEGRRLFAAIERPNVMIKVPGTNEGMPAVATLIGEGINVNVTLIFAIEMYEKVMKAYLDGLRAFRVSGRPLASVASVASFFVSRVDSAIDKQLQEKISADQDHYESLLGLAAGANAKIAYERYKSVFRGEPFAELSAAGARVQRPLWASTSAKNPNYPDLKYVDALIGPNTVNTVPPDTLDKIRDHAVVAQTIEQSLEQDHDAMNRLSAAGIDMKAVTDDLLTAGVKSFADSFEQLLADIDAKRRALAGATVK